MSRRLRIAPVLVILLAAALACNLQVGGGSSNATQVPVGQRPTVEILEPVEGTTFRKGQEVLVKARATGPTGVTLVELLVNGVSVASQPPADAINPTSAEVVLDYTASTPGTVILAVRAYSNAGVGLPAQRTIIVLPDLSPGTGGAAGTTQTAFPSVTPNNPLCRARVNASGLRFRTGPGTNYDIISNLDAGQEPPISGYADRDDGRWWQVTWSGRIGWVSASYTAQLGDCSAIRPAVVPASPTPQPSTTPQPTQPGVTATPTLPDLTLTLFEGVSSVQLGPDGTIQANYVIRVKNSGGQACGQFRVGVLLPNGTITTFDVPGLAVGQEYPIANGSLQVTFNTPGVTRILVTVDDQNVVTESNEANNQAYKDITVNPGIPTATPQPTATTGS